MSKEEKKPTFIFYMDWYNMAKKQRDGTRLKLYDAICQYAFDGTLPTDPSIEMAFDLIKDQIDRDRREYEKKCEKQRERIMKRWHPDGMPSNTAEYRGIPSNTIYDNDNDNDNEFKETPKGGKEKQQVPAEADASTPPRVPSAIETFDTRRQEFYNSLIGYVQFYGKEMIRTFYDYWSEPNKSRSKMRWEMEKTWDLRRRLITWSNRENKYGNNRQYNPKEQRAADIASRIERLLDED